MVFDFLLLLPFFVSLFDAETQAIPPYRWLWMIPVVTLVLFFNVFVVRNTRLKKVAKHEHLKSVVYFCILIVFFIVLMRIANM